MACRGHDCTYLNRTSRQMPPCLIYWKAADYLGAICAIPLLALKESPPFFFFFLTMVKLPLLPTQHWPLMISL